MKTLLLNNNYQVLSFVEEKRAIKLLLSGKVDLLATWEHKSFCKSNFIEHPAVLKMKYLVNLNPTKLTFSRKLVLRRDNYMCSYCNNMFSPNKLTIDHVIPKSMGGKNSFTNCVTACVDCNRKKSNKTLEQSGMQLKSMPKQPNRFLCAYPPNTEWHSTWLFYIFK